jgi:hypothetical protein
VRFVPVIVTLVPPAVLPEVGEMDVTVGGAASTVDPAARSVTVIKTRPATRIHKGERVVWIAFISRDRLGGRTNKRRRVGKQIQSN